MTLHPMPLRVKENVPFLMKRYTSVASMYPPKAASFHSSRSCLQSRFSHLEVHGTKHITRFDGLVIIVPLTPFDVGPKEGSALRTGFDTLVASGAAKDR